MSQQGHERPSPGSAHPGPGSPGAAPSHPARLDVTYGYNHLHEELDADLEQMATRPAAPSARPALSERTKLGVAAGVLVLAALLLIGVLTGPRRAALPETAPMADTMAPDAGGNGVPDPVLPIPGPPPHAD